MRSPIWVPQQLSSILCLPYEDIQHPQIPFIDCGTSIHARSPSSHNMPKGALQILASTYATIDVQISSSVNLPTHCSYFTVTHTRASPSFRAPPDVHHGTRPDPPKILLVFNVSADHRRMSLPVSIFITLKTSRLTFHLHMAHPLKCHPFKLTQIFVHTQFILIVQFARVLLFTRVLHFNLKRKLLVLLPPTHCCPSAIPYIMYLLPHYESPSLMPITFVNTPPDARCQVSSSRYFLDIQPQQISSPTQVDANRSSSPCVRSHDASSKSRHPTMQPSEAKQRKSAGKSNS